MFSYLRRAFNRLFPSSNDNREDRTGQTDILKSTTDVCQQRLTRIEASSQPSCFADFEFSSQEGSSDEEDCNESVTCPQVPIESLDTEVVERRNNIVDALCSFSIVTPEVGDFIKSQPFAVPNLDSTPVNNHLWFPPGHKVLTACCYDYLNYRCETSSVGLRNLLSHVESLHSGKDDPKLWFDHGGLYYSFCLGKVVSLDEVEHCTTCQTCFEFRVAKCLECGSSFAVLCRNCNPRSPRGKCEMCEPDRKSNDNGDYSFTDACSNESLKSASQLEFEDGEIVEGSSRSSKASYNGDVFFHFDLFANSHGDDGKSREAINEDDVPPSECP